MDIFRAIYLQRKDIFHELINSVDINITNDNGENLLHKAIAQCGEIVDELLDRKININWQNNDGDTPLHYAAHNKQLEIARKLIEKGANVNLVDKHGNTPLWYAIHFARDNYDMAELLIKAGADALIVNNVGKTVFAIAERRNDETLNMLLGIKPE